MLPQHSFTIGYPRLIHPTLIAIMVDLQSIVIYTTDGKLIGWIHQHSQKIEFAEGYGDCRWNLLKESELMDTIKGYSVSFFKIDGSISYRKWDIKTTFIYPPTQPYNPITIATEDQY